MNRIVPLIVIGVLVAWVHGFAARQPSARVRVAAASDLQFALDEVVRQFAVRHPSVRVEPTYGSSGNFHAQLRQRAPFDLFLSADMGYVRDLVARGVGQEGDLFPYAVGLLVVWTPTASALRPERDGLRALLSATRVAIGNPRHAPYGRAAEAALRKAGIWQALEPRLVLAENIAQAAQFVQSGAADAGLIAKSLTSAPSMRASGRSWEVPTDAYPALEQGGLVLPWASSRAAALQVRDFIIGPEGRAVLSTFGFAPPASQPRASALDIPEVPLRWLAQRLCGARRAPGPSGACRGNEHEIQLRAAERTDAWTGRP